MYFLKKIIKLNFTLMKGKIVHKLILENLNYKIYNVKDGHVKIEE